MGLVAGRFQRQYYLLFPGDTPDGRKPLQSLQAIEKVSTKESSTCAR